MNHGGEERNGIPSYAEDDRGNREQDETMAVDQKQEQRRHYISSGNETIDEDKK